MIVKCNCGREKEIEDKVVMSICERCMEEIPINNHLNSGRQDDESCC